METSLQALKAKLREHDEFCREHTHPDNIFKRALAAIEELEVKLLSKKT